MKSKFKIYFLLALQTLVLGALLTHSSHADTFNQSRIIDDAVFNNTSTMSVAYINSFLNQFSGSCISTNNGFAASEPIGYNPSQGFLYGNPVSAGQVIYDAAQAYGVNPQVLLSTLQKEEGTVVGNGPYGCSALALSAAAGFACTDSGTASHSYVYTNGQDAGTLPTPLFYSHGTPVTSVTNTCVNSPYKAGFSEQVIWAAWLLERGLQRSEGNINWAVIKGSWDNSDDPQSCYGGPMTQGTWVVCPSGAATYYDGYTTIDGKAVYMSNGATASLYWYTPHFSGNQSFFNIFDGWFGSTYFPISVVQVSGSSGIYLTFNGMKQLVSDMNTYNAWNLGRYTVQTISQAALDSMPTYTSPLTRYVNPWGNDTYYVDGGNYYKVSPALFAQWGHLNWQSISAAYPTMMGILTSQGDLTELVQTSGNSAIYLMDGGVLRPFGDYTTFTDWQPANADVMNISSELFSEYSQGQGITGNLVTSSGSEYLISNSSAYRVASGQRQALPSSWTDIPVDPSTIAARNISNLQYTVESPGDQAIYLLDGDQKRPFSTYDLYVRYANSQSPTVLNHNIAASINNGSPIDRSLFSYNGTYGLLDANGNLMCFDSNSSDSYSVSTLALSLGSPATSSYLLSRGCNTASPYVKTAGQQTIYALSSGTKLPVPDLNTLFSFDPSGSVTQLSSVDTNLFTQGSTLSKSVTNGSINYFVDNGQRFTADSATASAWSLGSPVALGTGLLGALPVNPTPLSNHININGAYYLIDSGKAYRSPTADITLVWGLTTSTAPLSKLSLSGLNTPGNLTMLIEAAASTSPYKGALYTVDGGKLLLISSMQQLGNLKVLGTSMKVSDTLMQSMGVNGASALHPYLVKDSSGNVFVINDGLKDPVNTSITASWIGGQVPTMISTNFENVFADGNSISQSIFANGNPVIYYLDTGQKVGFSSYAAYQGSGYAPATQVTSDLMGLIPTKP